MSTSIMGLSLVKKELQEAANDIRASVRSFVIKRKTRKLEFELRDIPRLLDLPKLSLAATTPNIIPYLSGEQLALAMGTCKAFYNAVRKSPELMERRASQQELNVYLRAFSACPRLAQENLRILLQKTEDPRVRSHLIGMMVIRYHGEIRDVTQDLIQIRNFNNNKNYKWFLCL